MQDGAFPERATRASFNLVFQEPHEWIDYASGRDGAVFVVDKHQKKLVAYDGTVLEPFGIDSTYDLEAQVPTIFHITKAKLHDVNGMDAIPYEP